MNNNNPSENNIVPSTKTTINKMIWVRLIIIFIFLTISAFAANYAYRAYFPPKTSGVEYDPKTGTTVIKAQIVDGKVIPPAQENPLQLIVSNTKIENGIVKSSIHLDNKGNLGFEKLIYSLYLVGPDEKVIYNYNGKNEEVLVDPLPIAQAESEPFSLKSEEKKTFEVELKYPQSAPSSDQYTFRVEIRPEEETTYAVESQRLVINQSGGFLSIGHKDCTISANNSEYPAQSGPNINPNEIVTAKCAVTNTGNEPVTAKSTLTYAERFVYKYTLSAEKTIDNTKVETWQPNETKTVTFPLPPQTKPEVYEAILQFVDQNNQAVSPLTPFRYVVRGPSAIVRSAELQAASYSKGEQIPVKIWASPSMDLFWNGTPVPSDPMRKFLSPNEGTFLRSPKLQIELTSASEICAQKTIDMPANTTEWNETTYELIAERGCKNPTLTAKIFEGNQELYHFQKNYFSADNIDLSFHNLNTKNLIIFVVITCIILVLVIASLIFYFKKKKTPPVPPIVALLIITTLAALGIFFSSAILGHPAKAVLILGPDQWITVQRGWTYEATYNTSTRVYYSAGRVYGETHLNLRCNGGCSNCAGSLGARIWLKIDGQDGMTNNGTSYVSASFGGAGNRDMNIDGYLPSVDLTTGLHSAEVWITPMYPANGQTSINIGGGSDNQCGMPSDICYGRVQTNWGVNPVGTITLANNFCSGNSPQHTFNFSANVGGIQQYLLDRNGVNIGSTTGAPMTIAATTGVGYNYTVRVQTASGTYGGSNTVNVAGLTCTTASLTNTSNTCSAKPNSSLSFNFTSNNPGNITTYYLDKNGANIGSTPVANPNITVAIPENDTSSYTVRAQTASGIVNGTAPVNVTAAACPYGQFAPVATCGNVRISWQPYATAHHYRVIYSRQSTGVTTTVPTTTAGTFLDITAADGLLVTEPYAFIVLAYNAADAPLRYSNEANWSNAYYGNTVFPDCRKPLAFTQNAPVTACGQITANWNLAGGPVATYQVRYLNSVGTPDTLSPSLGTVNTAAMTAAAPWNLQLNNYYTTAILATNLYGTTWSDDVAGNPTWYVNKPGGFWSLFPNCAAPTVVVRINNNISTVTPTVNVNQNSPAVIDWTITNSGTTTVSSNPVNAAWNATGGAVTNPSSGSLTLDTSVPGLYSFTRVGTNSFTGATDSKTITLNVIQYPRPFIQTTGGDIHTNETINITPNIPNP